MRRLFLLSIALAALPALGYANTAEGLRACLADPGGVDCAALDVPLRVCAKSPTLAGCPDLLVPPDEAQHDPRPVENAVASCPVLGAEDWRAMVGPVAGAEGPHLIVEGRVTLPTPAWSVTLAPGIADRSATPVQRVILTATPPQMMTAQVLTDYALRLETPSISAAPPGQAPYRGVLVLCGGQVLVDLTDIGLTGDKTSE